MRQAFEIGQSDAGTRLDVFLTARLGEEAGLSRAKVQALIKAGRVKVNDGKVTPHYALEEGDLVLADVPESRAAAAGLRPRPDISLDVVHEDDDVLVVNKPSGMLVHPAVETDDATLANALVARLPGIASVGDSPTRPGIVHRLDKDASGLLVIAKTKRAFDALKAQFKEHEVKKEYAVLVDGAPPEESGTIDFSIGRKKGDGKMAARARNAARDGDRDAVTHYSVDKMYRRAALLTVRTETGRTHQIRVHLHAVGCPVVGDPLYGGRKNDRLSAPRLFLHAKSLSFIHPATGERVSYSAPLPPELQAVLDKLAV